MAIKLSRLEQETIILYNEQEKTASIETANKALQRKLDKFCEDFPELFKTEYGWDREGFKRYIIPKGNIQVRKPVVLSEETLEKRKELGKTNAKLLRQNQDE